MNEQTKRASLEDVLESYAIETRGENNNFVALRQWMEKYPEYAQELMDFAAERSLIGASQSEISEQEVVRHLERSRQTLENFLANRSQKTENSIESLTAAAQSIGMNKMKFASAIKLSLSLVMYLEKRRLQFATIPSQVIKRLAETLQTTEERIASYLDQQPDFAFNANFKAQERPEAAEQKDFAQAVREDQSLTKEQKEELLRLS
jgi:hypothetical protein